MVHWRAGAAMKTRNLIFAVLIAYNLVAAASHAYLIFSWPDYADQVADPRATVLWVTVINLCLLTILAAAHWRGSRR